MDYLGFIILLLAPQISQAMNELCTFANTGADQHFCFTTKIVMCLYSILSITGQLV